MLNYRGGWCFVCLFVCFSLHCCSHTLCVRLNYLSLPPSSFNIITTHKIYYYYGYTVWRHIWNQSVSQSISIHTSIYLCLDLFRLFILLLFIYILLLLLLLLLLFYCFNKLRQQQYSVNRIFSTLILSLSLHFFFII